MILYTSILEKPEHGWDRPTDPRTPTKVSITVEAVAEADGLAVMTALLAALQETNRFMVRDTLIIDGAVVPFTPP
jgi:hypothetical protein